MNVIIFTSSPSRSGGARQALYLAEGLAGRGHDVRFFVPKNSRLLDVSPDFAGFRLFGSKSSWRRDIEAELPPDGAPFVLHAFHSEALKRAALWGLRWRKRAAVFAHRGVLACPKSVFYYWLPGIDRFLVNSGACARVLRRIGVSARRLQVTPNGIPEERLIPRSVPEKLRAGLGLPENAPVVGTVTNSGPLKGVDVLIRAFALVCPSASGKGPGEGPAGESGKDAEGRPAGETDEARLLIVGCAPDPWLPLARELGVADRTHFVEHTEDVAGHLALMRVFVLASLSESMPNTVLEAIGMGLPCVGASVGAVPEILKDCGLLFPPGQAAPMAEAIRRMLADGDFARACAARSLAEAENYRPGRRLDMVEGIYREVLRRKGLPTD